MAHRTTLLAAFGLLLLPVLAAAQIVTPDLTPPPCQGHNCLVKQRGATTAQPRRPGAKPQSCPLGTRYDPQKGTCKVMAGR